VKLYTGGPFKVAGVFSRMMSTLFVTLAYSSGMPILYFVSSIWFCATYFTLKLLILKYLKTTNTANRIIPQYTVHLLKTGLVVHMIGSSFMLTNPHPFDTHKGSDKPLIDFNII